jgi:putative hydrolase of the HAD superfamily
MPVLFDLDDTLLDDRGAQAMYLARLYSRHKHRLAVDEVGFCLAWRRAIDRHFPRYLSGEISLAEQRRARMRDVFKRPTMSDLETDCIIEEFLVEYEASWQLFPEVLHVLDALRGITLGVVTNGNAEQQMRKLERTGIIDRFRVVVVSERVGHAKPAPEIFQEACSQLGCSAADCVFVGDDWHRDVEGARRSGMVPVWLRRDGISAGFEDDGIPIIGNLVELIEKDEVRRILLANEVS